MRFSFEHERIYGFDVLLNNFSNFLKKSQKKLFITRHKTEINSNDFFVLFETTNNFLIFCFCDTIDGSLMNGEIRMTCRKYVREGPLI